MSDGVDGRTGIKSGPEQQSRKGRQRANGIQQSERERAGKVVQATLEYKAGF